MSEATPDAARLLAQAVERIRRAKAEVAESRRPPSARCPVAIVGLACRAPAARDAETLWANLIEGRDAIGPIPADRWDVDAHFDPEGRDPSKMYVRTGGFVPELAGFDPQFFRISPREAATLDPQQRLALEVAWHALEDAGVAPSRWLGRRVGVYLGGCTNEYSRILERHEGQVDSFSGTSNALSVVSGRIAYTLGFEGPAVSYDTACSSSLVAVHEAVRALQSGDCDAALAGGVNTILSPQTMVAMCRLNMLSPRGRCASFDAEGDGFARSEGCGVVVLERLVDAQRAGRRIRAVIRGSAVNQDGRSAGITAPTKRAQVAVIRAALADGELRPHDVTYVESHGTGTALGDPIEMGALGEALCEGRSPDQPLVVGAIKSCVGHAEAASGVLGLIKATLALDHRVVPPNLHFETPNPHIPWDALPVVIPTAARPWPAGLAGVNSFGFSGTNAHVVIGPAPEAADPGPLRARGVEVLPLSAAEPEALAALATRHAEQLERDPTRWPHLAASAARGREALRCRATVRAPDAAAAAAGLRALAEGREAPGVAQSDRREGRAPRVGFVFTGQGSQYAGMARALYAEEPVFAAAIDRCAEALAERLPVPLVELLTAEDAPIDETRYTQPALFAVQVALAALWRSVGVEPVAVLGHSVGAYAAAVVAGVMDLEDAAGLVAERGRLMGALPAGGAMAAVEAGEREVSVVARRAGCEIAAVNGPRATVVSGDEAAVEAAVAAFEAAGTRARRLTVSHAFHSARMAPVVAPLRARAAECAMRAPTVRFIDDRTGTARERAPTADDWSRHARDPVRFADALRALADERCDVLVELGPRPTLLGMARATLGDACPLGVPSIRPGRAAYVDGVAALWRAGAPVDWDAFFADRGLRRVPLPSYPFRRTRYWPSGAATVAEPVERATDTYDVRWRPWAVEALDAPAGAWLVVGGADGTGAAVGRALRAAGCVVEEAPGGEPGALAARITQGAASGPWRGVIDLAALDAPVLERLDPEALPAGVERAREATCDGVLATVEALSRSRERAPALYLVTRRAVSVGGEPADVAQAMRWGLGRVLRAEHRALSVGLIDLDAGPVDAALLRGLLAGEGPLAPEVAVRGGACYAPRLTPHRLDRRRAPVDLAAEGTILITGGLGGIGLALAERLVARGVRDLALMSRRAPSAEVEARIAGWAERGARVHAVAGDVASMADVRRAVAAIAERGPPLVGVVHAAGVLDDGLLVDLTPARFDRVIAPKVLGGLNLSAAVDPSCFVVLFSSIAGLLGTPGQGNYAAANVALDALAASLCARGRAALSIQWGPWAEVGMAARLGPSQRRGAGIGALSPARALDAFERVLPHRGAAVAVVDWGAASPAPDAPLFAELSSSSEGEGEAPDRGERSPPGHLRDALDGLAAEAQRSMMLDALIAHIGAVLELDPARIDAGSPAVDLGMDSLLVMEVLDRFKHDLGMVVYPREFYRQPSVRAMADYLLAELARDAGSADAGEPPPASSAVAHLDVGSLEAQLDPELAPPTPIDRVGFVLSAPRSGSTLLRVMLHGHPALFAPPELWLLSANDMAQRAAHYATSTLDQGYVQAVRGALDCSTAEAERRVAELVEAGAPTWEAYRALTALIGDRVLLDKTPTYGIHPPTLERIARWFAPGPLIHLVRHPIAVSESIVRTRLHRLIGESEADPWFIAEGIWTYTEENVRAFAAGHPDRAVHRVRFEDLVTQPRETIEALCDALGLGFEPAMLEPYAGDRMTGGLRPGSAPLGDQNFDQHRGVDARLADAWRDVELPHALDERTRALADELGYELPARRDRVAVPASPPGEAASEARPLRVELGRLVLGGLVWGAETDPAVLAVHGVLDHAGVWAPVAERLAARGLRVVALDLRGHGASDHVGAEGGYPPLDFVHDLAAVCGAIGGAPAAVVGHSLGAATAALHAAATRGRWPLVLIEPPLPGPATPTADSLAQWLGARTATARHPVFADRAEAVERLRRSMPGVPEDTLAAFAERALRLGPEGSTWAWDPRLRERADLLAGAVDADGWLTLLAGLAPTLIFAEDGGLVRRADRARMVAAVGEAARVVTLGGGHHLPLSAPDEVAAAIVAACRVEAGSSGA